MHRNPLPSLSDMSRIAQLEGLLAAADAEIQAQIRARLDLENKNRTLTQELRTTLQVLTEKNKRVQHYEENESKAATELASLAQRLTAVRNRKEELEKQVTTLTNTIATLSKSNTENTKAPIFITSSGSSSSSSSSSHIPPAPTIAQSLSKSRDRSITTRTTQTGDVKVSDNKVGMPSSPTDATIDSISSSLNTVNLSIQDKKEIHQQYLLLQGLRSQVILLRNMLVDSRAKLQTSNQTYEERIQIIEKENQTLLNENTNLRLQLSMHDEKEAHDLYDITNIKAEVLNLRSRLMNADVEIATLTSQIQEYQLNKDNYTQLHTEYTNFQSKYNTLLQQINEKELYITNLLNEKHSLETQIQETQTNVQILETKNQTLETNLHTQKLQYQENELHHTETMNNILAEINSLVTQQKNVETIVRNLQLEKIEANKIIHELKAQLSENCQETQIHSPILALPIPHNINTTTTSNSNTPRATMTPQGSKITTNANSLPLSSPPNPLVDVNNYTKRLNDFQLQFTDA